MKNLLISIALSSVLVLTGCNTVKGTVNGMGEDVQSVTGSKSTHSNKTTHTAKTTSSNSTSAY